MTISIPSLSRGDYYDGANELSRESTVQVFGLLKAGGKFSHEQIREKLKLRFGRKYQANTVNKVFGILRNAGYNVHKEHVPDLAGGYFVYWMDKTHDAAPVLPTNKPKSVLQPASRMEPIAYAVSTPQASGLTNTQWDTLTVEDRIEVIRKKISDWEKIHNDYPDFIHSTQTEHGQRPKIREQINELRADLLKLEKIASTTN